MVLFDSGVFIFFEDVIKAHKEGAIFNEQLPGFIRDLQATRGKVFIVIEGEGKLTMGDVTSVLEGSGFPSDLVIMFLNGSLEQMWGFRRRHSLDFKQCTLIGHPDRANFAKELNIKFLEINSRLLQRN